MKKRLLPLLIILIISILAFTACGLFAPVEPNEYTLTYEVNGGSEIDSVVVARGGLVTRPENPSRGYDEFAGWYKDAEFTTPWDFDKDVVTSNTTLYAKWNDHSHSGGHASCTVGVVCEVCGVTYGDPLGHNFVDDPAMAPTCTTPGLTAGYHCTNCDVRVEQLVIDALGHTAGAAVKENVVDPTCTTAGSYDSVVYCSVCHTHEMGRETVTVGALGHSYGGWIVDVEPTYTSEGSKHRVCGTCGDIKTEVIPVIDPDHTHSYTSEVTTPATCTENGVKTYNCVCGSSYTEVIPATGHTYGTVVTPATCTAAGYTTYTCDCGHSYVGDATDALGHAWGEWEVTTAPTYDTEGVKVRECSRCHETEEGVVDKLVRTHDMYFIGSMTDNWSLTAALTDAWHLTESSDGTTWTGTLVLTQGASFKLYNNATGFTGEDRYIGIEGQDISLVPGTHVVTYNVATGAITIESDVAEDTVTHEMYLRGSFITDWALSDDYKMTESEDKATWTIEVTFASTTEFKVYNKVNDGWFGTSGNNISVGAGTYVITYHVSDNSITYTKDGEDVPTEPEIAVTLYLVPNANWKSDNARFVVYMWNDAGNAWVSMTDEDGDGVWEAGIYEGYTNIIFCRMNPGTTANNWNNKWNQTSDLTVPTNENNCYTVAEGAWDKGAGEWSKYPAVHEHSYTETVTLAPTCTTAGVKTFTCECGDSYTEEIPVDTNAHAWDDGVVTTEPTCTAAGVKTYTCTHNAEHTKTEELDKLGHTDVADSNNRCDRCGESLCTEHTWVDADCTNPKTCSACGAVDGEALGHNWTPATCEAPETCRRCGETRGELADHVLGDWEVYEETDTTIEYRRVCACGEYESKVSRKVTLYYYTTEWTNVNLYAWFDAPIVEWPGTPMTAVEGMDGWFTITLVVDSVEGLNIIFNNGSAQSADLVYNGLNYWVGSDAYETLEDAEEAINSIVPPQPVVVYLKPNANWKVEGARFAVYLFGNGDIWVNMTQIGNTGVYTAELPLGYTGLIFCRMNPNNSENAWGSNGSHMWNQTSDLTVPTDSKTLYTVAEGVWDKGAGSWSEYTAHTCEYTGEITTAPTCTTPGVKTYTCTCGDSYTEEITATGHTDGQWFVDTEATCTTEGTKHQECSVCHETIATGTIDKVAHTEETIPAVGATCTATGLTEGKKCSVCGETLVAQQTVPKAAHTEETIPAVGATCTATGLTEGKKCSVCNEVTVPQSEVPMTSHSYDDKYDETCNDCGFVRDAECAHLNTEVILGHDSTCTATGLTDGSKCTKCGDIVVAQVTIPMKAHTEVVDPAVGATCTASGLTAGSHCDVCGTTIVAQEVVPVAAHTEEVIPAVDATCTATGLTEGKKCSVCHIVLLAQEVVPMVEHTAGEATIENNVDPTCTEDGSYDSVVKCSVEGCGAEISRTHVVVDALKHDIVSHVAKAPTCTEAGWYAYDTCKRDGCEYNTKVEIPVIEHTYGEWEVSSETETTINYVRRCACGDETFKTTYKVTVYFKNKENWANVNIWMWTASGDLFPGQWPGEATAKVEGTEDWYYYYIELESIEGLAYLFNDGTAKTADIIYTADKCYYSNGQLYASMEDAEHDLVDWSNLYFVGSPTNWEFVENSRLRYDENGNAWIIVDLKVGDIFKICDNAWQNAYNSNKLDGVDTYNFKNGAENSNIEVVHAGTYKFTVTADGKFIIENTHEHTWVDMTCTVSKHCSECMFVAIQAPGHTWAADVWTVVTAPTTDADGIKSRECSACGTVTDIIPREIVAKPTLYLTPNANWKKDNARFAAYFMDSAKNVVKWVSMTDSNKDGVYEVEIPDGAWKYVIFVRMNPATTTNNWDNKWNQTSDLTIPTNGTNHYTVKAGTWDKGGGTWSTITVKVEHECVYYPATCTEAQKCYKCGASHGEALGHSFTNYVSNNNATCTANGTETAKCDRCDVTDTRVIENSATGHTPGETVVENRTESTCTVAGYYYNVVYCSVCLTHEISREKVDLPLADHTAGEAVVENNVDPTCTEAGSYDSVVKCSVCLTHEISTTHVVVDALGHKVVNHEAKAPTCEVAGWEAYETCERCTEHNTKVEIPATGHAYTVEYKVIDGVLCLVPTCGCESEKVVVDTTSAVSVANEADLKTVLYAGYSVVLTADINLTKNIHLTTAMVVVIDLGGKTITADWVDEDGVVDVLWAQGTGIDVTITGNGTMACGNNGSSTCVVSATDGAKVTIENGTFTSAGSACIYATRGGEVVINDGTFSADELYYGNGYLLDVNEAETLGSIIVYGGSFKNFDPANHTNDGANYTNKVASGYHSIENGEYFVVNAHSYTSVYTAPTCTEAGFTTHTCVCGDVYTTEGEAALGHNYVAVVTAPTCTTVGYTTHTCSRCSDSYVDSEVPVIEHSDSTDDHKCDACGKTLSECVDEDPRDHECDVCGLCRSDCVDANKNHKCDICNDTMSRCADNDQNHFCDYCGVQNSHCINIDPTVDHKCDWCGAVVDACVDEDPRDHECDVCGLCRSDCVDANKNHMCDICNDTMSRCADNDQNHFCDYCGVQNSHCMDLPPYNHICNWCGEKMSECTGSDPVIENNVDPTCTEGGSYDSVVYCSVCGDELSRTHVTVAAKGHVGDSTNHCTVCGKNICENHTVVVDEAVAATCTNTGLTEGSHCGICGDIIVAQEVVPATGHAATVEYKVIGDALYLVPTCGCESEKVAVDTTVAVSVANEADLKTVLYAGYSVVLTADINLTENIHLTTAMIVVIDLDGNTITADWTDEDGVVDVLWAQGTGIDVTITGNGTMACGNNGSSTCVVSATDGAKVTIENGTFTSAGSACIYATRGGEIVINGGTFSADELYNGNRYLLDVNEAETLGSIIVYGGSFKNFDPANHTNDGANYTNKVAPGYHSIENGEYFVVSAHSYTSVYTAPTCTVAGFTTYTCVCGDVYTTEGEAALGHDYDAVVTPATCTTAGYTTYTCSVCGDSYVDDEVAAKNHAYGEWTKNNDGTHSRVCGNDPTHVETENCSYESVVTPSTCEEDGYTTHTCSVCGHSYVDSVVDALTHNYSVAYGVVNGDLKLVYTCQNDATHVKYGEKVEAGTDVEVANEADLKTVLYAGYSVVLTADINLTKNIHLTTAMVVVIDLGGKTITADWVDEDGVVDVLWAQGTGIDVTITGNGTMACGNNGSSTCVVSATDGAKVTIENGTFTSAGSACIYATRGGEVVINGGTFSADELYYGNGYLLDVNEAETLGSIIVYGGSFKNFDPANHTNDGANYTNKVASGYHSMKNGEYFVVSAHSYTSVYTAPTCTAAGFTTYTCVCGDVYTTEGEAALGHDYDAVVTPATCTTAGYTTYTCSVCGGTYVDDEVPALGHTAKEAVKENVVDETCTTAGSYESVVYCSACNAELSRETVTVNALGHSFTNYVSNNDATCTENGTETAKCDRCDVTDTRVVENSALDHSFTNYISNNNATCTEDGTKTAKCDRCDVKDTLTDVGSALGHTGGEATCTTLAVCTRCSESYGELAAHTFGHWVASDDKKVRECTECGASDEESFVKDANTIYTAPGKIYLDAYSKDWGYKDARYAVYIWNAAGNTWINMDATDKTGIYSVTIPEGYTHIIFCRMNGASTVNDWPNVWNQSTDIVLSEANVYTFNGNWDHYVNNNKKSTFDISTLTHDHVYNALTAGCLTDVHCVLCGDVKATANGHVHGEAAIENNVAPDCVNAGSYDTVVYCTVCNAEVSRETTAVDALGHEYDSVVTPATCTTAGYTTHTCSVCGHSYVDGNVDALGHKFTTYTSNNDATCTKDGTKTAKCDRCDVTDTLVDEGSALGHTKGTPVTENSVAPDCVNAGSYDTVVYCTVCNAEVSRETTTVDALGHKYTAVVTPATCTTAGYTTHTCSVCDDSYVDGNVDALGHKFTTYTSNNDATCTKDGTKTAKCDRCDVTDTLTDVGSALGHTEGEVKVENATAPTCTENGSHDNVVYCVICDAELSRVNEIDLAIGHAWNDGEVLVDATCTETGTMKHTCTRVNCGATEERPIPAKGHVHGEDNRCTVCNASLCEEHSVVIDEAVAATCTSTGLTEGKHCSVCNEVLVAQTVTEKLAHNYVAVVTPATCTTAGYTTHTCSGCNASYTDSETAALGHTSAAAVEENRTESTCTVAGSYDSVVYCSACGAEISRETIALSLAAHTPAEAVEENRVNSTCTAAGSYDSVVYCSACGAEISRETIALSLAAHTPAEAVEENRTESTCTAAGSYDLVVKCSACGAELSRETKALELAAHTPAAAVEENRINSTCTVAGSYDSVVKCSVCSAELSREKVDLELAAHTPATAVEENRTESTCTVAGSYESVVYCSACDTEISRETKTLELAAHAYGKWLVSGDNKVRECANCDEIEEGSLKLTTIYLVPGQWISDNPWFVAYFFNNSGNTHVKMTDSDNDGIYEAIVPEGYTSVLFCRMNPAYAEFGWNSGEKGQPGFIERVYNQSEDIALKDNINTYTFESWSNGSDGKSTFISSLGKHEHVYTTATCTENMKCCYGCGEEIENTALNHDHVAVVTPATCTTAGYTTYTCSRCGDTYTDSAVDALNHDMSDFVTTTAPSCEEDGVERSDCSRCDYFETRVLDAIGHKYTDDNDADCNNEGCEHTREVGCAHTNTIVLKAKAPTCIEDGYTEGLYCEDCKETLKAQETVGKDAENGHNYSTEWTVDVEPTCTAKGSKSNHCIYCESKANVTEVAAIGHTEITVAAVAATLTKWGKSEGKKCSVCGVTTVAQTTVKYVLYLKPNSNWTQASARFAAYFFNNSTNKNEWVSMTKTTINGATYYKCEVPEGYEAVIFCRMNPSATANNWNNKWNQSGDLFFTTIGNGKNVCSINNGQWDCGTNVTWSKI